MHLILIDGYGFIFRAYYSLPPLTRPGDKLQVGAIYGFVNMILKLLEEHKAGSISIVLDAGGKNFRHELYDLYKAHRPQAPEDLIPQLQMLPEVVEAFGIKCIKKERYEADDLIASYAVTAKKAGHTVTVISSDKDLIQLLPEGIELFDAMKAKKVSEESVIEKYNVTSNQFRDFLALIGDASDNIPGVKGIGPKTAADLISKYTSMQGIYENLNNITQARIKNLLTDQKQNAFLSYKLVGLDFNAPIEYDISELILPEINYKTLSQFLDKQGFKSLVQRVNKKSNNILEIKFTDIKSEKELKAFVKDISESGMLFFWQTEQSWLLSSANKNYSISISKDQASLFDTSIYHIFYQNLKLIFEDSSIKKITFNSKSTLKTYAINCLEDVLSMAYSSKALRYSEKLSDLGKLYNIDYDKEDSYLIKSIYEIAQIKLIESSCVSLYEFIDKPLLKIVGQMEQKGLLLDLDYLDELTEDFSAKLAKLESEIFKISGKQFNIASPKQLSEILFKDLQLPSKSKKLSTSSEVLESLSEQGFDIADLLIEWRHYSKLITTYTKALPKAADPNTKRVHTNFLICSTSTGRFSSNNPNLQNIPTNSNDKVRKAFIAKKDYVLLCADYSQIELRLLADTANIQSMKLAFDRNEDIHAITASEIFSVDLSAVTPELRRKAKMINFGIIYGITPFGLAKRLGITNDEAKNYIDKYFQKYAGIKEYMNKCIQQARNNGYVTSIFNRKCEIQGISDKNFNIRNFAERAAINAPLQSSAADIIRKAMVALPNELKQYLILQIHDELVFEVPKEIAKQLIKPIKDCMQSAANLSVKLVVDVKIGENWGNTITHE